MDVLVSRCVKGKSRPRRSAHAISPWMAHGFLDEGSGFLFSFLVSSSASSFNHLTDRVNEQLPHVPSLPSRAMPHSSRACTPSRVLERDQSLPHVASLAITQQQEAEEMCAHTDSTEPVERRRNILGHRDVRASSLGKVVSSTLLSVVGLLSPPQLEVLLLVAQGGLWKRI